MQHPPVSFVKSLSMFLYQLQIAPVHLSFLPLAGLPCVFVYFLT